MLLALLPCACKRKLIDFSFFFFFFVLSRKAARKKVADNVFDVRSFLGKQTF